MARGDGWLRKEYGIWRAVFYWRGRKVVQSLRTADEDVARKRLVALRRARERGEYQHHTERRVTVGELLDDYLADLERQGRASLPKARSHSKAVRDDLGHRQARELTSDMVHGLALRWLRAGTARATVNRRLEALGRAFRLARRQTPPKVREIPHFELLHVENTRRGFIEPAELDRLLQHLPADLADFTEWCYVVGMRRGEAAQLTFAMLDRSAPVAWELKIPAAICKNRDGRVLPVVGRARRVMERRLKERRLDTPLIFHRRLEAGRRPGGGQPILDMRIAWKNALKKAGLPKDRLFHDLRRSAARNMTQAGVSEKDAMLVTGHKTRSMFDRYNIRTVDDARAALERQERFFGTGHETGHAKKD